MATQGTYDFWTSPSATPVLQYLALMANYRTAVKDYFISGRMLQPLPLAIPPWTYLSNANATFNAGFVDEQSLIGFSTSLGYSFSLVLVPKHCS